MYIYSVSVNVREAWFWLRQRFLAILPPDNGTTSNFEFLNLMFQSSTADSEIVWLLGVYLKLVSDNVIS